MLTRKRNIPRHQVFFHRTSRENAKAILREGFIDGRDEQGEANGFAPEGYTDGDGWEGVWLSIEPLGRDEGAFGNALLRVSFPGTINLAEYEIVEDGKPYREWMMPAEAINTCAVVELVEEEV